MQDSSKQGLSGHGLSGLSLGLTDVSTAATSGCGCGGACGGHGEAHGHSHAEQHAAAPADGGQTFAVAGMTCSHCVSSVTEELTALDGVEAVAVDLHPGALSTVVVTASRPLGGDEVRAAVEEAGYTLASGCRPPPRSDSTSPG
jgi:copper chaperone